MTKKVVAINGSPRNRRTLALIKQISAILSTNDIEVKIINLRDYDLMDCTGCETCIRKTSVCWQKDGTKDLLEEISAADGLILASPVYVMNVSGKLKTLIDKTAWWIHRPQLAGKPALVVSTTAGSGLKDVHKYLDTVAIQWGMQPVGRIGRKVSDNRPVAMHELKSLIWHLNHPKSKFNPSLKQMVNFQVQKVLALKILNEDLVFWKERGWDKAIYYYPARIGLVKQFISRLFFEVLNWRINPGSEKIA